MFGHQPISNHVKKIKTIKRAHVALDFTFLITSALTMMILQDDLKDNSDYFNVLLGIFFSAMILTMVSTFRLTVVPEEINDALQTEDAQKNVAKIANRDFMVGSAAALTATIAGLLTNVLNNPHLAPVFFQAWIPLMGLIFAEETFFNAYSWWHMRPAVAAGNNLESQLTLQIPSANIPLCGS